MNTSPPIGAYAMTRARDPLATVYRVASIRGRVLTSVGVLVSPSPTITIENVKTKERLSMSLALFHASYRWEYVS